MFGPGLSFAVFISVSSPAKSFFPSPARTGVPWVVESVAPLPRSWMVSVTYFFFFFFLPFCVFFPFPDIKYDAFPYKDKDK
jgi:hypothetical protein